MRTAPDQNARPRKAAAPAVRFLASDAAGYVTATTLFVDGGMSA
ncbi:MAG TPA: SDR family oxidoreductase [Solirubrobacteraceae bacterium]|nr:SDR family oxidoreductase [Solirubrobacteraceae bacterium]